MNSIQPPLINRDLSILAFNERVLDWAAREEVPLLERLRYLSIVSSNLDEYFEVRMANLLEAAQEHIQEGEFTEQGFLQVNAKAHALVERQYNILHQLHLAMEAQRIRIVPHKDRTPEQRRWVSNYFRREVMPLLLPISLDPAHPFPQVANKSLNFIVKLGGQDALGRSNSIAIIKVPRVLPRLLHLPPALCNGQNLLVSLPSVLRTHLAELFPNRSIEQLSQFRVTRHSDLAVDEDDADNLLAAMREGLQQRHYGRAVRIEVSSSCSEEFATLLCRQFEVPPQALYRVHGPVNLVRIGMLIDLVNRPELMFPPFRPVYPLALQGQPSLFARMREGDVLVHQPFESFDPVIDLLREAVNDPQVVSIKQTIYRTGSSPVLIDLLSEAFRRGKEVTALVELKARFDEEANINWSEQLEAVGAQVVYGVLGLKTHAKMLLITRREGRRLKRYGHLSTGNYSPRTARIYTDLSYFTANDTLTGDMQKVFAHLASQSNIPRLSRLLMAPYGLQNTMLRLIQQAGRAAAAGQRGRIVAKMNALTDEALIRALIDAGQKGAQIDLIVRGACMLPAQLAGVTHNIRVRSIIGRLLEHSRVYYFDIAGTEHLYLSSADWMNRNMLRRIEVAWPVTEPALRQRIIDECLLAYLHDEALAWQMQAGEATDGPADGNYQRPTAPIDSPRNVQQALMLRYRNIDAPPPASTQP
ncbi:MAG: polyphosphate kinase 1 [Brachymonas sp.]|nr:polyphosphate kinase 1 [Brachymonas sp.]